MVGASLKRLLENDQLVVGISELSDIVGVSPRQLRYWEQRDSFVRSKLMRIVLENIVYLQS